MIFDSGDTGDAGGYLIANSVRLRASASASFYRTFGAPTNNPVWTYSEWFKQGQLGTRQTILSAGANSNNYTEAYVDTTDKLVYRVVSGGSVIGLITSNEVVRDPTGHRHLVLAKNGTTISAKVNGGSAVAGGYDLTWSVTNTITSGDTFINSAVLHALGARNVNLGAAYYRDGVQSETRFVDGQFLDPSYFAQVNADGVWVPKGYSGTWGNNGSQLKFDDGTSLTTLGYDSSGNGNHWTASGVSLTAGANFDHFGDTPTKNFPVLSPIDNNSAFTLNDGNLKTYYGAAFAGNKSTIYLPASGLFYWEASTVNNTAPTVAMVIMLGLPSVLTTATYGAANSYGVAFNANGWLFNQSTMVSSGLGALLAGDTVCVAADVTNGKVWFGKNGTTWWDSAGGTTGNPATGANPTFTLTIAGMAAFFQVYNNTAIVNFGQRPFAYTPPTGYKALCTANMPAVAITNPRLHHEVVTVTKSGNTNFSIPWDATLYDTYFEIKRRDAGGDWYQIDGLRGYDKVLKSNSTGVETTDANVLGISGTTGTLKSTLADGAYVVSMWKAGLVSARQTNTDGTITSTVSANVTAGFSIVKYTGSGANATVGHGLGVALKLVVDKALGGVSPWPVFHASAPSGLYLNQTSAQDGSHYAGLWNSTAPTSSVFSLGTSSATNTNAVEYVAYCHAEVPGFSKFDKFTGNGSADGPAPYCGFTTRYLREKNASDGTKAWLDYDTVRSTYNPANSVLQPNVPTMEVTAADIDIVAGGIKLRTTDAAANQNTATHVYEAYAKHPFGGSNVAPAPAR